MNIIKDIKSMDVGKIIQNYDLKDHTTYKVGGKAICAVIPDTEDQLILLLSYLKENKIKYKVNTLTA